MAKRCIITGKSPQVGNNVSHAKNRTKRRFLPNLQDVSLYSEALGKWIRLRISVHGIRTVEHNGGIDAFVTETRAAKLDSSLKTLRIQVLKAKSKAEK